MPELKQSRIESSLKTLSSTTFAMSLLRSFLCRTGWVSGSKSATRVPDSLLPVLKDLETLTRLLDEEFCLSLPRVPLDNRTEVKEFCDGILDPRQPHEWRSFLRDKHIGLNVRSSVCATLFLFRKRLPQEKLSKAEVADEIESYIRKMTTPQPRPRDEVMAFAAEVVRSVFRPGWDAGFFNHVDNFTLPVKSSLDNRGSAGGSRGLHSREGRTEVWRSGRFTSSLQASFEDFTCSEEEYNGHAPLELETRPTFVWTGGKNRLVTVFSSRRSFLAPLHRTIYDRLSRQPWLLRGEAERSRFSSFRSVPGEVFVSGDYTSASDNLNIHLSRWLLYQMSLTSRHVPSHVWAEAIRCLTNTFDGRVQERGQLMGSLLSFPLLCLTNYVAFKFAVRRDVPVLVNGDDIVFRGTVHEKDLWMDTVRDFGLSLSRGKTLVTRCLFSLNSTFFLGKRHDVLLVPFIRSSCLFTKGESPASIQGLAASCCPGFPERSPTKEKCLVIMLRRNAQHVWVSQRSIIRGLRTPVSWDVLRKAGLVEREGFYASLPDEPDLPPPFKRWQEWPVPTGWRTKRVEEGEDDVGFGYAMVQSCWSDFFCHLDISHEAYISSVQANTFRYVPFPHKRFFKLLGNCSERYESLRLRVPKKHFLVPTKEKIVWVKVRGESRALLFTSAGFQ